MFKWAPKTTRQPVNLRRFMAVRLPTLVVVMALAAFVGSMATDGSVSPPASSSASAASRLQVVDETTGATAEALNVQKVASFQGCNWVGKCSVKLNRAETSAVAAGFGVYISILNVHVGAAFAAAAIYAIERGQCLVVRWWAVRPNRLESGGLARC